MIKSLKFILTGVFFYTCEIYAQTLGVVKGTVKDKSNNEALPGSIVVLDKAKGVSSDINGVFYISTTAGKHQLTCELIGYQKYVTTITVAENDTLNINISLADGNKLLDEVVVSAGRFEQKLSDVTVSMEVIKPTLIENKASQTLDLIMNQVPGVVVSDGQASIRGGSGYSYGAGTRVLMLVDEMPMISADAADIKWNYLPIENLEQVEVIKGASSALFGSSALNGVVNMRTAYAKDKPQTTVSLFGATYDAPKNLSYKWWKGTSQNQTGVNFSHAEKLGQLDLVLGGHLFNDEGYRYLETERRARFNMNLRYNFKKVQGLSMGINTNMMDTRGGLYFLWQNADSVYVPQGLDIQRFVNHRLNVDPYINYYTKKGGKYSLRSRYFLTNNTNNKNQGSRAELYYSEFQYQKHFKNNFTMTYGAVYMEQQVIADSLYGRHSGKNYAGYAQFDYKFKKLTTSLGIRGEFNRIDTAYTRGYLTKTINNLPFQPVFRAGMNYHLFEYTFLRASFGQGYRFPTIAEKYVSTNVSALKIFPNPSLQAERGWSAEIGIKQGFKLFNFKGFIDVAGFWTEYADMVEFAFDVYGNKTGLFYVDINNIGFKSQNVGRARITGIDASITGTGKMGPINVTTLIGFTYTNPIYLNYDPKLDTLGIEGLKVLKYRNQQLFKADIQLDYKKVSIGWSTRYYSYMENVDRRFEQSILHEYNDKANGVDWDAIPSTYILPGLKEYRADHRNQTYLMVGDNVIASWAGDWIHDFRASYQVSKTLKASFIVNNILNTEYSLRPGDVRPPRMFLIQLMLKI
ncbi:MAG: TonB-dependent receptor [Bacteroidia bacterium]|nr:TonB-dependent receptor [Bacteroidia bacterium]